MDTQPAKIEDLQGFEKFGTFVLNKKKIKSLISLVDYDTKDKRVGSHTYLLVVDGKVKKIGCSVQKLTKYAGYGSGNGGSPSVRTTGIHYYIAAELLLKKQVEFYVQMCPKIENVPVISIFGLEETYSQLYIEPKSIEGYHIKHFKKYYRALPEWNKQEQGRDADWETSIKEITRAIKAKKSILYKGDQENNIFMKLYHWKHGDDPFNIQATL